jgi:hypothetical protein
VLDPQQNDPRFGFKLDTVHLTQTPAYLRFEPTGSNANWNLASATALVYTGDGEFFTAFRLPDGFDDLWLGDDYGKSVYLLRLPI